MTDCLTKRSYVSIVSIQLLLAILISLSSFMGVASAEEPKDHMKAFLMSFLVPGLGQYYAGAEGYAKLFITAEIALWSGYFYNATNMESSRHDYYSQAALHAGVNPKGMGGKYLNAVGGYNSSFEYNSRRLQNEFNPVLYSGDKTWEWDSVKNRQRFRELRERELDYDNNGKFFVAGIVLNHFLAGLNASRLVQSTNAIQSAMTVNALDGGLLAMYRRSF